MAANNRQREAMDAQGRQAIALERIAEALERIANQYTPQFHPPDKDVRYDLSKDELDELMADVPPEDYFDGKRS